MKICERLASAYAKLVVGGIGPHIVPFSHVLQIPIVSLVSPVLAILERNQNLLFDPTPIKIWTYGCVRMIRGIRWQIKVVDLKQG